MAESTQKPRCGGRGRASTDEQVNQVGADYARVAQQATDQALSARNAVSAAQHEFVVDPSSAADYFGG